MDELFQLVVFLAFFLVWVLNAVSQAKKRRQEELEEAFEEFEEGEEFDAPPPSRRLEPSDPVQPPRSGWEEIQRELRKILEEKPEPEAPRELPPPPPRRSEPVPAPTLATAPRSPQRQTISEKPTRPQSEPIRRQPQPPPLVHTQTGRNLPQVRSNLERTLSQSRPVGSVAAPIRPAHALQSKKASQKRRRRFPDLHPDPFANAILLAEVLKPYSGPRPFMHRR